MDEAGLARALAVSDGEERAALAAAHSSAPPGRVARELRAVYAGAVASDPALAKGAAAALEEWTGMSGDAEARAFALWTSGLAALQIHGQPERGAALVDAARCAFESLGLVLDAAATGPGLVYALALLGRYDEAIARGTAARDILAAHGDSAAAGRIEQNLGNIDFRRDRYREAEEFYRSARSRFAALGDTRQLAQANNCLATARKWQHDFRAAAELYREALAQAEATGQEVTQAEIERNLGCLGLFQGRYGVALDFLERARRRYTALDMPHRATGTEHELADAYLELNLVPEALALYERVIPAFEAQGLKAEQAAALAQYGRAMIAGGRRDDAGPVLARAQALFREEGNAIGEAGVALTEANLRIELGDCAGAAAAAAAAEAPFAAEGAWRRLLEARWLGAEARRLGGDQAAARTALKAILADAAIHTVPVVEPQCHTSLGLAAAAGGLRVEAEHELRQAIALIEGLRAPLPAEEFRSAFAAGKLAPYHELARLLLDGPPGREEEALAVFEQARARALADMVGGTIETRLRATDSFESELLRRLAELREELNWYYSQLNRPAGESAVRSPAEALEEGVRTREEAIAAISRQLSQRRPAGSTMAASLDVLALQAALGPATALVEYCTLDDELLAFVVTAERLEVFRALGSMAEAEALVRQFRFQAEALRGGGDRLARHLGQLAERSRRHLAALYDLLLRPLEDAIGGRRLAVVPVGALHYLPFHALHDGEHYVVERSEVTCAPSASILWQLAGKAARDPGAAVVMGVADERTPRVLDEAAAVARTLPGARTWTGDDATVTVLREEAPGAGIVHLACHGQFRPDNPLFSALQLGGGWLTVRDAYELDLEGSLVTLSACETGVSAVAAGDELLGLARGFFAAGARALVVSLWTVDDESAAELMVAFYQGIAAGLSLAAALREAQRKVMARRPHPYYWSPFVLMGSW